MKLVSSMAGYSRIRATRQKTVPNLVTLTLCSSSSSSSRGSCTAHAGTDFDEVRRRHGRYTGHSVVLELSFVTCMFSMSGILHSDLHNWQHAICIMSSRDSDRPMTMSSSTSRRQSVSTARWSSIVLDSRFRPHDDHRMSATVRVDRTMTMTDLIKLSTISRCRSDDVWKYMVDW